MIKHFAVNYAPDTGAPGGAIEDPLKVEQKPEAKGPLSFTQEQLDAMFGDRVKRAEESATQKLLKQFGVESVDGLKANMDEFTKIREAQKSETDKAAEKIKALEERALKAEQEREQALAIASEKLMRAAVIQAATEKGFRPEAIGDVWLVVEKAQIKEDNGEFTGVKEAVEAVAKSKPFWMVDSRGNQPPRGTPAEKQKQSKPLETQEPGPVLRL